MQKIINLIIILTLCCITQRVNAQYWRGNTGLLTIPTADMQPDGTFMTGANYLPSDIVPFSVGFNNTMNYFLNITFFPFFEMGYNCTLLQHADGTTGQDRIISVRFRPLKESKWLPAIVLGSGDILTTNQNGNIFESTYENHYYDGYYAVATKHLNICNEQIGVSIGYNYISQDIPFKDGLFYGISYRPSFCRKGELMVDYNTNIVSIGAAIKLFNHLSINLFCYDFKAIVGGLRYEVKLY